MSELMDQAVIGMPYEMAMESELSRRQFYSRAQSILAEAQALRGEVSRLRLQMGIAADIASDPGYEPTVGDSEYDCALHDAIRALRARVVVPDGYALVPVVATDEMVEHVMATGLYHDKNASAVLRDEYRHMIDAAPRLNGNAVSEGLLRRAHHALDHAHMFIRNGIELGFIRMPDADTPDPAKCTPGIVMASREELSDLLGEGKEHE